MYPRSVSRTLTVVGVVLVGLVIATWHRRGGTTVDHWVAARLDGVDRLSVTSWLGHLTAPWYVLGVAGAAALRHEIDGNRRRALAVVLPVVAALAVTELVLKPGVGARATSGAWTFPSGNVTGGVALVMGLFLVEVRGLNRRGWAAAVAGLAAVVALSALALVADRVHFFTDAVGAGCVGAGVPLAMLGRARTVAPTLPR